MLARVRPEEAALAVSLTPDGAAVNVLARLEQLGGLVNSVEFAEERRLEIALRATRRSESVRLAEELAKLEDVERLQWHP